MFDGEGLWSFGNYFDRNVASFGVDNSSSSSHTDNGKKNILVVGKGPTNDINASVGAAEKSLVLILVKQT